MILPLAALVIEANVLLLNGYSGRILICIAGTASLIRITIDRILANSSQANPARVMVWFGLVWLGFWCAVVYMFSISSHRTIEESTFSTEARVGSIVCI